MTWIGRSPRIMSLWISEPRQQCNKWLQFNHSLCYGNMKNLGKLEHIIFIPSLLSVSLVVKVLTIMVMTQNHRSGRLSHPILGLSFQWVPLTERQNRTSWSIISGLDLEHTCFFTPNVKPVSIAEAVAMSLSLFSLEHIQKGNLSTNLTGAKGMGIR